MASFKSFCSACYIRKDIASISEMAWDGYVLGNCSNQINLTCRIHPNSPLLVLCEVVNPLCHPNVGCRSDEAKDEMYWFQFWISQIGQMIYIDLLYLLWPQFWISPWKVWISQIGQIAELLWFGWWRWRRSSWLRGPMIVNKVLMTTSWITIDDMTLGLRSSRRSQQSSGIIWQKLQIMQGIVQLLSMSCLGTTIRWKIINTVCWQDTYAKRERERERELVYIIVYHCIVWNMNIDANKHVNCTAWCM